MSECYDDPNISGSKVTAAPALTTTTWAGDNDILKSGERVEILAVDPAARLTRHGGEMCVGGVPARTACWIRCWPEEWGHARYRSCDLADLDLSEEGTYPLWTCTPMSGRGRTMRLRGMRESERGKCSGRGSLASPVCRWRSSDGYSGKRWRLSLVAQQQPFSGTTFCAAREAL